MKHYLFCDNELCEDFIVGAYDEEEAYEIARSHFIDPEFIAEISEWEAENSGLDEW